MLDAEQRSKLKHSRDRLQGPKTEDLARGPRGLTRREKVRSFVAKIRKQGKSFQIFHFEAPLLGIVLGITFFNKRK